MNMQRALNHRVRSFSVHHIEHRMDRFIVAGPEQRSSRNFARAGLHHNLHEPLRLALLHRAPHPGQGTFSGQRSPSATFLPAVARRCVSDGPACPVPMTMAPYGELMQTAGVRPAIRSELRHLPQFIHRSGAFTDARQR